MTTIGNFKAEDHGLGGVEETLDPLPGLRALNLGGHRPL